MVAKAKPAAATPKVIPMGTMIDTMFDLREEKRKLDAQADKIGEAIREQEEMLMERMAAEGTDKASGKKASVSVTSGVVADVVDWDTFGAYIIKNKFLHLLQRRVSDPAWRELMEKKGSVPGTKEFVKKKLNLRVLGS